MERTGLYAGTFDPITNGHLDVLEAAARICDRVVIAIGIHPGKKPLFETAERKAMIEKASASIARAYKVKIEVITFDNLVITAAKKAKATLLIRGLRDGTDFDYEMQMSGMNSEMDAKIQTVFIPATPATRHITGTLVRQIAAMGGDVSKFVPDFVVKKLTEVSRKIAAS
ncbi:MAG: pantetheine-phosphate adenylyltransferase [Xanthobacteraceae bacterium]|nr:pantetheine-phosphate adenylyltransferase [Xanthobacteraceae bacterium]